MPAYITEERWLRRFNPEIEMTPEFQGWSANDPTGMPNALRQTFAFLRRHGGGRYSASSLMKLLQAADRLDEAIAGGFNVLAGDIPTCVLASVPFAYDEDTEVKSGGMVAAAAVLPDGRLMMAVNSNLRRVKLGQAMYNFVTNYFNPDPVVWVHQANTDGAQFALSIGLQPREVTSRGAVAWSMGRIRQEADELATEYTDDYMIEEAVARNRGPGRARQTPRGGRPEQAIRTRDDNGGIIARDLGGYFQDGPMQPQPALSNSERARLREIARLGSTVAQRYLEPEPLYDDYAEYDNEPADSPY